MSLPSFDLSTHRALVTGASSGLGRHFAATLAAAGAAVVLAARRVDKLAEAVAELRTHGGCAFAVELDVTDRASVCAALDEAARQLGGPPDIVVNSAGTTDTKRALDYDDADWDRIVDTNLKGCWIVAQEASRRLVAAETGGTVINVTSILGVRVAGGVTPYCASKGGLRQLTQALALEFARFRIRVNALAPGYIATDLNREFLASKAGETLQARIPARRFGTVQDLDGALLLLASDASAYMTGSEIVVDGGHLCSSL
jgi:NAD(P)-dependent dehydrogenase (short-subunit alcohol dehydrogenase family)